MHDQEEINATVWEALARKGSALSTPGIVSETGLPKAHVAGALGRLRESNLISLHEAPPNATFVASLVLDAWRWAHAVDLGIPLSALEKYAALPARQRADALRVAGRGEVDESKRRRKEEQAESRRQLLQGRAASKAAATDLARLAEDAKLAHRTAVGEGKDAITCSLLKQMHASAQGSLDKLRKALEEA